MIAVFLQAHTQLAPFSETENSWAVLSRIMAGDKPNWPTSVTDQTSLYLSALTERCWSAEPASRPKASEVVEELARCLRFI
jgi:hypothetical protein